MKGGKKFMGKIVKFNGVSGCDVYNPTAPFEVGGERYLAARVEERNILWQDHKYTPQVMFFVEKNDSWFPAKNIPIIPMEDPFKTFVSGLLVFGGVEIYGRPGAKKFRTVFFKGKCPRSLKKFSCGPEMMKDIRLVELPDKKIGIFTRPQGKQFKKGRIGFTTVKSLDEVNEKNILKARIIRENLGENQWEGVNSAKLLESGNIAVLAHKAELEKGGQRNYQATTFVFNLRKMKVERFKVIAKRDDFPETPSKKPFLRKVVFPGEINYKYFLWAGISDTSVGTMLIENPYGEKFYKKGLVA